MSLNTNLALHYFKKLYDLALIVFTTFTPF